MHLCIQKGKNKVSPILWKRTPFSLLEATKLETETIGWCWIVVAMTVVAVWVPKTASCSVGVVSVIAISAFFRGTSSIYARMLL
jgi:hypothetical protein